MLSQLFVFHKSKNFTSDYEIRMPIPGRHRLWLRLGRYLIVFEPPTFVLD
uniref:Uncharacterized protein n=1 Tax=Triticum urartu TaxID=4572 RepID=A0A8R7JVM6_TRIUA